MLIMNNNVHFIENYCHHIIETLYQQWS
uniref:Uncharacterized protein n=1 Tax=Heterorhabditis bacteriophora TaxID=37862 RepID=A0A1I7WEL6_HETBA